MIGDGNLESTDTAALRTRDELSQQIVFKGVVKKGKRRWSLSGCALENESICSGVQRLRFSF